MTEGTVDERSAPEAASLPPTMPSSSTAALVHPMRPIITFMQSGCSAIPRSHPYTGPSSSTHDRTIRLPIAKPIIIAQRPRMIFSPKKTLFVPLKPVSQSNVLRTPILGPQMRFLSSRHPTAAPPIPRDVVLAKKRNYLDYPGDRLAVYDITPDKCSRVCEFGHKTYRTDTAKSVKDNVKFIKPWNLIYQATRTTTSTAGGSRTVVPKNGAVNGRTLKEKNGCLTVQGGSGEPKTPQKRKLVVVGDVEVAKKRLRLDTEPGTVPKPARIRSKADEVFTGFYNARTPSLEDSRYLYFAARRFMSSPEFEEYSKLFSTVVGLLPPPQRFRRIPDTHNANPDIASLLKFLTNYPVRPDPGIVRVFHTEEDQSFADSHVEYDDPQLADLTILPHGSCSRVLSYNFGKSNWYRKSTPNGVLTFEGRNFIQVTSEDEQAILKLKDNRVKNRAQLQYDVPDVQKIDAFVRNNSLETLGLLKFAKSPIHGYGLFALAEIEPGQLIIEYVGEKIRTEVSNVREKKYQRSGIGSSYLFRLDNDWVIDATKEGNIARFINHCCQPNCYARINSQNGTKRIDIISKTFIHKGEELTYDYKFPFEETKIVCHCGAKTCKNFLN